MKIKATCLTILCYTLLMHTMDSDNQLPLQQKLSLTNEKIIEQCLEMTLPQSNVHVSQEALSYKSDVVKNIEKGNYQEALEIVYKGLAVYPQSFMLQTYFAALIGDLSEQYTHPLKQKMIEKSKQAFNKLLSESAVQPKRDMYRFKNEYYYRFGLHEQQYISGQKMVDDYWKTPEWLTQDGLSGYYYQGVGATYYAKQSLLQDKKQLALEYAHKALVAWAQYFSWENNFYNAYVHYALALGILGNTKEMMHALQRGADLIKKDLSYHEFQEVITFVGKL
jgi:tetratricopeptide (TPR) repeat protein